MSKIIHNVIEFIEKIIQYPFRKEIEREKEAHEKKCDDFLAKVKKSYSERTDAENIIFYSYYILNIKMGINHATKCLQLGATEATLILEGFLKRGENYEDFQNLIKATSEKYLKEHNII